MARRKVAEGAAHEYLAYLYSDEAQELAAKNGFRPSNPDILRRYTDRFDLKVKLTKISDFGGWEAAYVKFFNDDALFDKIMADVNGDAAGDRMKHFFARSSGRNRIFPARPVMGHDPYHVVPAHPHPLGVGPGALPAT